MRERGKKLLNCIIKEHIRTTQPVGSDLLVDKHGLKISPATIRNEMAELERQGYLTHPYTSAGRIPTEKGYYFYLENFLKEKKLDDKLKKNLKKVRRQLTKKSPQFILKKMAKILAELSKETILVAFNFNDVYFTGLTNLFRHPEFRELDLICSISQIIDHFDERMGDMFDTMDQEIKILAGSENPFSNKCSVIISEWHFSKSLKGVIGILGPMRMDYDRNISLLKYIKELINN